MSIENPVPESLANELTEAFEENPPPGKEVTPLRALRISLDPKYFQQQLNWLWQTAQKYAPNRSGSPRDQEDQQAESKKAQALGVRIVQERLIADAEHLEDIHRQMVTELAELRADSERRTDLLPD